MRVFPTPRPVVAIAAFALLTGGFLSLQCRTPAAEPVDLSPRTWPEEADELIRRELGFSHEAGSVEGGEMMIIGTTGAPAVRAGWEALMQGGSAVDAALTTSLTQIALAAGSWVSYAGLFTMVVYDAKTGEVYSLSSAFGIPRGETEPLTIPAQNSGVPSGRTALVPGFMAGVGAAHARFGKLPFAAIFEPAIYYAEEGFELPSTLAGMIASRRQYLERLPETRAIFFGEDGEPHPVGHLFKQPELAATLRAVARDGTDTMYTGPWAEQFVEIVQREGGKITLDDLAEYEAIWGEPIRTEYDGFEIAAIGLPTLGGVNSVECLNIVAAADLDPYQLSPEALFWWMQITNCFALGFLPPPTLALLLPGVELTTERRVTKEWAGEMWGKLREGEFALTRRPVTGTHSDAVVTVDGEGNVVALVHSINTVLWGETGMFVDGVSIPDAASYQQHVIAAAGPGTHLPDPTNPFIVLRDGRPVLASSSIGGGLHQETMQCVYNVLLGLTPVEAIDEPSLLLPQFGPLGTSTAQVPAGAFDEHLIQQVRDLGQPVNVLSPAEQGSVRGYWIGIHLDPATGNLSGGFPAGLGGGGFGR